MHKSTLELALSRAHMAQGVEIKSGIESLGVDMHSRLAEITEQVRELHARITTPDDTYDPRKDRLTQKLEEHLNLTKQRLQFPVAEGTKDAETSPSSLERLFAELDATPNVATTEPYLSEPSLGTRERINRFPTNRVSRPQPQPPYLTSAIRHLNEPMAQYGQFATIPTSPQGATENAFAIGAAYRETRALCTLEELNRRLTLTASHTSTDKPCSLLKMCREFNRDWDESKEIEDWNLSLGSSWEETLRKREEFHDNTQQQFNFIYLKFIKPIPHDGKWLFDHLLWRDDVAGRIYRFVVIEVSITYIPTND
ncbi:hypothetical protein V8F33_005753 [Rhypophila sp. PSN 637]